jgi:hypothetical protein
VKLKYDQVKKFRINYNFFTAFAGDPYTSPYWYNREYDTWIDCSKCDTSRFSHLSSGAIIRTVRAFRRKLRKWNKQKCLPSGTLITLASKYKNHDVYARIK